jgi:hypothetical protein
MLLSHPLTKTTHGGILLCMEIVKKAYFNPFSIRYVFNRNSMGICREFDRNSFSIPFQTISI